mmetsp:Transcript_64666/g.151585  ORF Transcript_64666/g.151585 Transcript_64666/m.151585 type:complete len:247 (+) Transcript_64666:90-830(+)
MGANLCSQQGAFSSCTACTTIDAADWIFCLDSHGQVETKRLRKAKDKFAKETLELDPSRLETLTMDLFKAHDLNGDGFLQEMELITLNERIAMLHHGKGAFELQEVRDTYSRLFRTKLDPQGRPIPFEIFRRYARGVLEELDQDPEAQEMILEQFVAEAWAGRESMDVVSVVGDTDGAGTPVRGGELCVEDHGRARSLDDQVEPMVERPNGELRMMTPQSSGRTLGDAGPPAFRPLGDSRQLPDGI